MSTLIVTGRVGSDATLRETQNGTKVAQFSVADDIGWGDKKKTQWLKCTMFGDRAAKIAPYLTKGSMVEVIGTPQVETWNDKTSQEARGTIAVTVSEVKLHGGGKKDETEAPKGRAQAPGNSRSQMDDDSIPF